MSTVELTYGSLSTAIQNWQMVRGDTRKIVIAHEWTDSTINEGRFWMVDSSGVVAVALTIEANSAQWDIATDYELELTLRATDTEQIATGDYAYAVEFRDASTPAIVYTPVRGTINVVDDVVNDYDSGTNAPLSWASRTALVAANTALESEFEGLATCHEFTWVATAASSGAGTLVVSNGAIFTNGDTVRIELDDGTYQETTVTVSTNTLTLGDNLTNDVSADNIVRIV